MSVSVVPALIDALVTASRAALPAATAVYDGFGVSDDPGDYLMVGVDDPDRPNAAASAQSVQEWANANHTARNESGYITCVAMSWNGDSPDTGQKAARDAAYAITEAVAALCRADPPLGVDSMLWTSFGTVTDLQQSQDESGALALLVFQIAFRAYI